MQLSQKEKTLLKDQQSMEEVCVEKYNKYAQQTQCAELKQLFTNLANQEQNHYNTVTQLLQGGQPNISQGNQMPQQQATNAMQQSGMSQQGGGQSDGGSQSADGNPSNASGNKDDKFLCSDLLATEKFVSGTYDTAVFEAVNPAVRQALQHIQKEEQQHGEQIFNYMHSHGMYQVQ